MHRILASNGWLLFAGVFNLLAALTHIGIIIGGANWYRFFGAGEPFARLAEQGSLVPPLITLLIATTLFVWSAYCFSALGVLPPLPYRNPILVAISTLYIVRGLAIIPAYLWVPSRVGTFLIVSSALCCCVGGILAYGTWRHAQSETTPHDVAP